MASVRVYNAPGVRWTGGGGANGHAPPLGRWGDQGIEGTRDRGSGGGRTQTGRGRLRDEGVEGASGRGRSAVWSAQRPLQGPGSGTIIGPRVSGWVLSVEPYRVVACLLRPAGGNTCTGWINVSYGEYRRGQQAEDPPEISRRQVRRRRTPPPFSRGVTIVKKVGVDYRWKA